MLQDFSNLSAQFEFQWLYPLFAFAIVFIGGKIVLHFGAKNLAALAQKSHSQWDDQLIKALRRPFHWLILLGSLAAAAQFAPEAVSLKSIHWNLFRLFVVVWLNWLLWVTASTLIRSDLAHSWSDEARSLVLLVLRISVIVLSILGIADGLGLSITPVLASLGVGSLAVALALQDTLSNFFAGIYLLIDKPVRINDFVKVDDSTEGHVFRIGWRSTWLKQLNNNIVVIPNSKLLSQQVTNYDLAQSECYITLSLGVAYDSNLEKVEKTLIVVAEKVLREQNQWTEETPLVRFQQFGDSSIDLRIAMKLKEVTGQFIVRHELIKAIHKVFQDEKIEIPFPQRTVRILQ